MSSKITTFYLKKIILSFLTVKNKTRQALNLSGLPF